MAFMKNLFMIILAIFVSLLSFPFQSIPQRAEKFRVTAYIAGDQLSHSMELDRSHFEDLTDVILIGVGGFDTEGKINLAPYFESVLELVRKSMEGSDANLYLNIGGPGYTTSSTDWNEQMDDLSNRHEMAFASGVLEQNILDVLEKYGFDGVFFDYEYPLTQEHWDRFDAFLLSLDKVLGDGYKIGAAISGWNTMQSKEAIAVLDMVEVMAYDMWDKDGTHASLNLAKGCIKQMRRQGYKKEQLDLGIPFYARPTTGEAYWYAYRNYYQDLDEKGLCFDAETGLTFSFNNYDAVYEKTKWAISKGLGGVMVWHYACDIPKENEQSLFNAIVSAKTDMIERPFSLTSGN